MKWILLFYAVGDILTTWLFLSSGNGYEANTIVLTLVSYTGWWILPILKLGVVWSLWKLEAYEGDWADIVNKCISWFGVFICINNLMVYKGMEGIFQIIFNIGR
jgi:hypothetical protein